MHRTPTGPAGRARTMPTSMPFSKKPSSIPAPPPDGRQSRLTPETAQPETRYNSRGWQNRHRGGAGMTTGEGGRANRPIRALPAVAQPGGAAVNRPGDAGDDVLR